VVIDPLIKVVCIYDFIIINSFLYLKDYITGSILPVNHTETKSFRKYAKRNCHTRLKVRTKKTYSKRIDIRLLKFVKIVKNTFKDVSFSAQLQIAGPQEGGPLWASRPIGWRLWAQILKIVSVVVQG